MSVKMISLDFNQRNIKKIKKIQGPASVYTIWASPTALLSKATFTRGSISFNSFTQASFRGNKDGGPLNSGSLWPSSKEIARLYAYERARSPSGVKYSFLPRNNLARVKHAITVTILALYVLQASYQTDVILALMWGARVTFKKCH